MRASEFRGLRWQDVDLDEGILHVTQRADAWRHIGAPKSAAGTRTIPACADGDQCPPAVALSSVRSASSILCSPTAPETSRASPTSPSVSGSRSSVAAGSSPRWESAVRVPLSETRCGVAVHRHPGLDAEAGAGRARPRLDHHDVRSLWASLHRSRRRQEAMKKFEAAIVAA